VNEMMNPIFDQSGTISWIEMSEFVQKLAEAQNAPFVNVRMVAMDMNDLIGCPTIEQEIKESEGK
jgi:hypothetical protein